jgi:hypothetical protein
MSSIAGAHAPFSFESARRRCAGVAAAALAAGLAGALAAPAQFFRSYLVGYLFWLGVALGSLGILMLHHLVGGRWGTAIRRPLESAAGTLPLLALLFAPLLLGLRDLYSWSRPGALADELIRHKSPYLNLPFFLTRAAIYWMTWILLARVLSRWSAEEERTGNASFTARMQRLSGPGLVLFGLTVTFAGYDWVMSLEPKWSSSIFGMLILVGQGLSALAFMVIVTRKLAPWAPYTRVTSQGVFNDLGNLLLMFVMLWAYLAFSQFLVIWAGNLPEEIAWYRPRIQTSWVWIGGGLLLFYFFVPFLLLLSRRNKRSLGFLAGLAGALLAMRLLDLIWTVEPTFDRDGWTPHWMDLALPAGLGGVWLFQFLVLLQRSSPPRGEEPQERKADEHA